MIKKIIGASLFGLLVISLFLYLGGVRADSLNDYHVQEFLSSVTNRYNSWSFKIPSIPKVPTVQKPGGAVKELLTAAIWIANALLALINFLIMVVNFVIVFLNTVIAILQFIITLVVSVKDWLKLLGISNAVSLT